MDEPRKKRRGGLPPVVVTCQECGKGFMVSAYEQERKPRKYCSHRCWGYVVQRTTLKGLKLKHKNPIIEYEGCRFYLIPQGYYASASRRMLHRAIWEHHNGPIPDGCVIHHIDGCKTNNDISNLQLMTLAEHSSFHNKGKPSPCPRKKPCSVPGCGRLTKAHGLCQFHYRRKLRGVELEPTG